MAAKAVVLDPQMKILLDTFNAAGPMFLRAETPEQARAKMQALMEANPIPVEEIYRAENRRIPGGAGEIPLTTGDVIRSFNGQPMTTLDRLRAALKTLPPGAPIVLQIQRDGKLQFVTFSLE